MSAIRVELLLADGSFTTRMLHAGETVRRFNENVARGNNQLTRLAQGGNLVFSSMQRVNTSARGFLGTMRDLTVVSAGFGNMIGRVVDISNGWLGSIIRVNAEMERLDRLMRAMSTASDPIADAASNVRYLRDMAQEAPFSLRALQNAFVKLKSTGTDPLDGSLQSLIDGIAAFGGSEDLMNRAAIAIQQMSGKGVIQMEELRQQLGEAIPRATELMARSLGVTYGELVQTISTGRLLAEPALRALSLEMERTFGGSARAMMETFVGQVSLVKTNLQELATSEGNQRFFDAIKDQLQDLNEFLSSDVAMNIANMLGDSLVKVVGVVRDVVDKLVEFRREILAIGKALAIVVGVRLLAAAISSFTGLIGRAVVAMRLASVQFALMRQQTMLAGLAAQSAGLRLQMLGPAMAIPTTAARTLAVSGVGALTAGLRGLTAALPVVGIGILAIATLFDIFSNKARDAWQELEQFGASSVRQVEQAADYIQDFRERIDSELGLIDRTNAIAIAQTAGPNDTRVYRNFSPGMFDDYGVDIRGLDFEQARAALEARYAELTEQYNRYLEDAQAYEVDRQADQIVQRIDRSLRDMRRLYDEAERARVDAHEVELREAADAGEATQSIQEAFQQESRDAQLAYYDQMIEALRGFYAEQEEVVETGSERDAEISRIVMGRINEQILDLVRQKEPLAAMPLGIQLSPDLGGFETAFAQGQRVLTDLTHDIFGLQSALSGADEEVADLIYRFSHGEFGDVGNEQVQELIRNIISAQREFNRLENIMDGRNRLLADIQSLRQQIEDEILELQNPDASAVEMLGLRIQRGDYGPLTAAGEQMEAIIDGVRLSVDEVIERAAAMAETLTDEAFGQGTINAAQQLADVIAGMADSFQAIQAAAAGLAGTTANDDFLNRANAFLGIGGQATAFTSTRYYQNLVGAESSGNPNASNSASSAVGLGQFIRSTWLEFISEIHPELIERPEQELLDLRTNVQMMNEAIEWYTRKNASAMAGARVNSNNNGIPVNDANLYLGHFLGTEGMVRVLSAFYNGQASQSLSNFVSSDVISANAGIRHGGRSFEDFTLNDLVAWAQSKMGGLNTAIPGTPGYFGPATLPETAGAATPTVPVTAEITNVVVPPDIADELVDLDALQAVRDQLAADAELSAVGEDTVRQIQIVEDQVRGSSQRLATFFDQIRDGVFGEDRDVNSARYAETIEWLRRLDEAEQELADNQQARSSFDSAQEAAMQTRNELLARQVALTNQLRDAQASVPTDSYASMQQSLQEYVDSAALAYGTDSQQYREALAQKEADLRLFRDTEILEQATQLSQQNEELRRSMMSERDQRRAAVDDEIRNLQRMLSEFQGNAEQRILIEEVVTERIRLLRQEQANASPYVQQMKEWADFSGNVERTMTGFMNSASQALADFVTTGKGNFKDLINSLINDLARLAFQSMFAGLKGNAGATGGAGKGVGSIKGILGSIFKVPVAHTGGIAGSSALHTRHAFVPSNISNSIRRFHNGGVADVFKGGIANYVRNWIAKFFNLGSNEEPIIVERGEWILNKGQIGAFMRMLGGGYNDSDMKFFTSDQRRTLSPIVSRMVDRNPILGASLAKIAGVPKFHTGGIVGAHTPTTISNPAGRDRAVINQMPVSNRQEINLSTNVTVNASGGTPEQNDDMARRTAKAVESSVRGLVVKELMIQLRPGGILSR